MSHPHTDSHPRIIRTSTDLTAPGAHPVLSTPWLAPPASGTWQKRVGQLVFHIIFSILSTIAASESDFVYDLLWKALFYSLANQLRFQKPRRLETRLMRCTWGYLWYGPVSDLHLASAALLRVKTAARSTQINLAAFKSILGLCPAPVEPWMIRLWSSKRNKELAFSAQVG